MSIEYTCFVLSSVFLPSYPMLSIFSLFSSLHFTLGGRKEFYFDFLFSENI